MRTVDLGVYGAVPGKPGKGQNWRGETPDQIKKIWSRTRFEESFATTSCDATGSIQMRWDDDDNHWLVALTVPFEGRNQSTWRVTRIPEGQLWDLLLPAMRALRELTDDQALKQGHIALDHSKQDDWARRRRLLPILRALEIRALEDQPLPSGAEHYVVSPCIPACDFEDLLICAAFHSELLSSQVAEVRDARDGNSAEADPSPTAIAVLSQPVASREHRSLLQGKWDVLWAPPPEGSDNARARRPKPNTKPFRLEESNLAIRGVQLTALQDVDPDHDLFLGFVEPNSDGLTWDVPLELLEPEYHTDSERLQVCATLPHAHSFPQFWNRLDRDRMDYKQYMEYRLLLASAETDRFHTNETGKVLLQDWLRPARIKQLVRLT